MSVIVLLLLVFIGLSIWSVTSSNKKLTSLENSLAEEQNARRALEAQITGYVNGKGRINIVNIRLAKRAQ